jgi:hypothetical protein
MFLMRLEKAAPTSESSRSASASDIAIHSEERRAQVDSIQTVDTSAEIQLLENALQAATGYNRRSLPQLSASGEHKSSLSTGSTQLQLLGGSSQVARDSSPSFSSPQGTELQRFNASMTTSASVDSRAQIAAKGMTVEEADASWSVVADYALLYNMSFLRGELEYFCGHHQRAFTNFQLCLQHTTQLRQQIACFKQLIRLKTISGEYLLALILGVRALSLLHFELQGLRLDGKAWTCDQRRVEDMFNEIIATVREKGCEGDVARLFTTLPICTEPRLLMIGEILVELIYAAHLSSQTLLQLVVFSSVSHTLRHGVCKLEGFAFCMFGASLLARSVASEKFLARDASMWGACGLNLCLQFNNQTDYCVSHSTASSDVRCS